MRHFTRTQSAFRRVAERHVPGKQVGSAILSTKMLHEITSGNMVPRAAPTALATQPQSWVVTVSQRNRDGAIEKLHIRTESQHEVPEYAAGKKEPGRMPKGWSVKITKRDHMNMIRELHISPGGKEENG
jgi:hypothetical protein